MTRARFEQRERDARPVRAGDVLWFNYPTYLASVAIMGIAAAALKYMRLPGTVRAGIGMGALVAAWWLAASTAVAMWVFQLSGVTRWAWLPSCFESPPSKWLNVTTGFDDTTPALTRLFGSAEGLSVDVFNSRSKRDGAILRARRSRPPTHPSIGLGQPLPVASGSRDAVFLLMAAHELRDTSTRRYLMAEVARALTPTGRVVMVEHPRTGINAAVFGPGVFHFYSRDTWLEDATASGLQLERELPLTRFAKAWTFVPRAGRAR
jgi:SAM-dependent methyltransferase